MLWTELAPQIDNNKAFNAMSGTPYFRDAVYDQFSRQEYARRYAAMRGKLRELELDAAIVPGGPSHWSFGGGMLWLSGHWEWHALAAYVVVPLEGEPTLIYSMGGTHIEAVRRVTSNALGDVRSSRGGKYAEVMVERLKELGLENGRIGLLEIDPRHEDYLPVNQYNTLRAGLPNAEIVFTVGIMHELLSVHSPEELDAIRMSGKLCQVALEAVAERAKPGVTEQQLRAAIAGAVMDQGGELDFTILASTPMDNPSVIFGNPRPSNRVLQRGDIIINELAVGYRGYAAQIGSPICIGPPNDRVKRFWDEIVLPGFEAIAAEIGPGKPVENMRVAAQYFRQRGAQSRPIHCHGIDLVTDGPHVFGDHIDVEPFEEVLKPGMVVMAEPNPVTSDGMFGIFLGHTFIVTESGKERIETFPWELVSV
ncbi:MAG TPA: Xaa-Pro peptidase family protein [Candidatus Aquilonibacter sp.]